MQYRKYKIAILVGLCLISAQGLLACKQASVERKPDSITKPDEGNDGREPASMQGVVNWLDDVGDKFNRIASDTSNRAVASENEKEMLIQQKNWSFSYLPKTNHFYIGLQGEVYSMVQTSFGDGESYAFAAEGQAENPVTLSVIPSKGREVASGSACNTEISYWNAQAHRYVKDSEHLSGKACARLMKKLKDYVP